MIRGSSSSDPVSSSSPRHRALLPSGSPPLARDASPSSSSGCESDGNGPAVSPHPPVPHRNYKIRKSTLLGLINWTHVASTFVPHTIVAMLFLLTLQLLRNAFLLSYSRESAEIVRTLHEVYVEEPAIISSGVKTIFVTGCIIFYLARRDNPIYLLTSQTFEAPASWKVTHEQLIQMMKKQNCYSEESLQFMAKILDNSGTGQSTAWPPGIVQSLEPGKEADFSIKASREEAEFVITDVVSKALKAAKVRAKDIDILIINCSLFSPTPSLCAIVASKFGMRSNCLTYNLSGMGCSASLISIDLAKNLLQHRNTGSLALVVSTEVITPNLYRGNEKSFLLQNTLFRCGGAAVILSNKMWDGRRAMYKLLTTVRTQGTDEASYNAVFEDLDSCGNRGVALSKSIVTVAGKTMEKNLTTLGPIVLPLSEQIQVVYKIAARTAAKLAKRALEACGLEKFAARIPPVQLYVPDFKRAVDHFCIHAGGRAVIDGIEKNLKLSPLHTEPSRQTLYHYGNTSSSSIWYELKFVEDRKKGEAGELRKGHRVLQIAFGSGFKCNSAVWLKL